MNTPRISLIIVLVGSMGASAFAGDETVAAALHELFAERHAWQMREFPRLAMRQGDYSNADKVADGSLEAIERRYAETKRFLERLLKIDRVKLGDEDQLNYDLFEIQMRNAIEGHRFRAFLEPIGGRFGPHQSIPQMHVWPRFQNAEDYANFLTRLEQTPKVVVDVVGLLKLGVADGITPPRVSILGVPKQLESLLAGGLNALAEPFDKMPESISDEERAALRRRFDTMSFPVVRGAFERLSAYMVAEYLPKCRTSIAAYDRPDGEAYYAFQLRVMTTTNMTAREIHETGLSEVARIRAEMLDVIRSSDFMEKFPVAAELDDDKLFKAFVHYLRTDPRFYHKSEDQLLAGYRDICKRLDAQLPRLFGRLPRLPYGVRKIPDFMAPNQTTAYYSRGDIRNGQPGYFYANTYALDQRPKYEMISLAIHEAVPGHHLQSAIAQELENVPEFRKNSWYTAYGEGWALYSERLGIEMGMYRGAYDNFGRLLYEMWRACRLVVDPGMHAFGWSRARAVQFMLDNTALSEVNINAEIDRYIGWPGQATAYKIGELKIRALRKRAEEALGERFDLRGFHDVVLGAGSIPLNILERRVERWIRARLAGVGG